MTKQETKRLIEDAVQGTGDGGVEWEEGGPETIEFSDPNDVNVSGTATVYRAGYVRLELILPPHRAGNVIRSITGGLQTLVPSEEYGRDDSIPEDEYTPFQNPYQPPTKPQGLYGLSTSLPVPVRYQPPIQERFVVSVDTVEFKLKTQGDELAALIADQKRDMDGDTGAGEDE